MTLKQLEAFYWAANCASFAVAAERVSVSTSSLSKRISELESALGCSLFDRSGQKALLTDAGERLLPRAQALLRAADETTQAMQHERGLRGTCRFGVGELTALTWLPAMIKHLQQAHHELRLEPAVEAGSSLGGLAQRVVDGSLDFAIVAARSVRGNIVSRRVGQADLQWVVGSQLKPAPRALAPAVLERLPLVTLPEGSGTAAIVDASLEANELAAASRLRCNSWPVVASLLANGLGVGLLPMTWARALQRRGSVRALEVAVRPSPLQYYFQSRRDDPRPLIPAALAAVQATVDFTQASTWLSGGRVDR